MTPTVAVVLLNYNGLTDTRQCLRSLSALTYPRWFPVVVDNASRHDPTAILEAEFPGCPVVRNAVNGGWAGGNNLGIRFAQERHADFVVLLNNDTTVAPQLIDRLIAAARPEFGILGPVIRHFDPPHSVQTDGCTFNTPDRPGFFQRSPVPLLERETPAVTPVDIVNGCCMMIAAGVFRKIGRIDEKFFLVHEESDFCLRARSAGFHCGVIGEALIWHKGSQSFRRSGLKVQRYYDARNLFLLLSKHGYLPGRRRGMVRSLMDYLKYSYARYESERDGGADDAAIAVLEGVCDALTRHFGPHRLRSRPLLPLLRRIFEFRRNRASRVEMTQARTRPISMPLAVGVAS